MSAGRRARRAFTLVELLAALVVTGLVAATAYGALGATLDAREALEHERRTGAATALGRAMLADALRHSSDPPLAFAGGAAFEVADDRLRFYSRGVVPPYGTGGAWRVTLAADAAGARLVAEPPAGSAAAPIALVMRGVRALRIAARPLAAEPGWTTRFSSRGAPAAVAVRFVGETADLLPPLVVRTGAEVAR